MRPPRLAPAISCGARRTTVSPRSIKNRSRLPETFRTSSTAHTRSASSARAHSNSCPLPAGRAGAVLCASSTPSPLTAAAVWVRLCGSTPIVTIHKPLHSLKPMKRTSRRTFLSRGAATLLSGHARTSLAATGDNFTNRSAPKGRDRTRKGQPEAAKDNPQRAPTAQRPPRITLRNQKRVGLRRAPGPARALGVSQPVRTSSEIRARLSSASAGEAWPLSYCCGYQSRPCRTPARPSLQLVRVR